MTKDRIHGTNGHQIMIFNAPTCVEHENYQAFTFKIEVRMVCDMHSPIGDCLVRRPALLHVFGRGTFTQ